MKKAIVTNRTFLLFTLLFILIAAISFAAFQTTEQVCSNARNCSGVKPFTTKGEMIWDVFSRRLITFVSLK